MRCAWKSFLYRLGIETCENNLRFYAKSLFFTAQTKVLLRLPVTDGSANSLGSCLKLPIYDIDHYSILFILSQLFSGIIFQPLLLPWPILTALKSCQSGVPPQTLKCNHCFYLALFLFQDLYNTLTFFTFIPFSLFALFYVLTLLACCGVPGA